MKRCLLILLCLLMVLSSVACGEKEDSSTQPPASDEQVDRVYAVDKVINRFFAEFVKKYDNQWLDPRSIRRAPGTADTKPEDLTKTYLATINGIAVTLSNTTYTMENDKGDILTIYQLRGVLEGGKTEKSRDEMMKVFRLIAPIADPDCTTKEIDKAVTTMEGMTGTGEVPVSLYLQVSRFTPIVEKYGVPTKIEFVAQNYVPLDEK